MRDFLTQVGSLTLDELTANHGNTVIEGWRSRGLSTHTICTRRKYLKNLLRHLTDCGAPRSLAERLTKTKTPRPRQTIATSEELKALSGTATGWLAVWLEITAGHGLRFSEAQRLADIHFDAGQQTIKFPTKGGETNELPATAALQEFFYNAPPTTDAHEPLIERYAGHKLSIFLIRKAWRKLLAKAGCNPNLRPHDLRRTLAVRSMDSTNDMRVAQHVLGHQSLQTTALYLAHRDPGKIRPLLEELRKWTPAAGTRPQ